LAQQIVLTMQQLLVIIIIVAIILFLSCSYNSNTISINLVAYPVVSISTVGCLLLIVKDP